MFELEKDFMKIGNIEGDFMEFGKDEKKSFVQLEPKPNPALAHPTPPPQTFSILPRTLGGYIHTHKQTHTHTRTH